MLRYVLCVLLVIGVRVAPASAGNYIISEEMGNDANSCASTLESNTPNYITGLKKSFVSALSCVSAGDTISATCNRDGSVSVYTGANNVIDTAITSIATGGSGSPVTLRAWAGHAGCVVIRPPDGSSAVAIRTSKAYLRFENLILDGSLQTGTTPLCTIYGGANNILFKRMEIKNSPVNGCIVTDTGANSPTNTFERSTFHDNVLAGLSITTSGNTIQDNKFYDNGIGLTVWGSANADSNTIERNRAYDNAGVGFIVGSNLGGNGNVAINNLSYGNNAGGVQLFGTGNDWSNNVTYANGGSYGLRIETGASGTLVKNNISYFNNVTEISDAGTSTTLTTNQTTDPSFSDAVNGDFTLGNASTARNAGTTLGGVARDFRKYPRPQGSAYDIGAYEMPDGCPGGVCTVTSDLTADIQTALYQAKCGETVKLTNGQDYDDGSIVVPSKAPCTTPTTLTRTGTLPDVFNFIDECLVVGPDQAAEIAAIDACKAAAQVAYETNAPKLTTTTTQANNGTGNLLAFAWDADYWTISGIHFRSTNTNTFDYQNATGNLIMLGLDGSGTEPGGGYTGNNAYELGQLPDHIVLDRLSLSSVGTTIRAIYGEGSNVTFQNSLCYGMKNAVNESDSQCYFANQSPGPYLITNDFIEAAGEGVLFGGGGTVFNGLTPSNIEQSYNVYTKDWTWWALASRVGKTFNAEGVQYQPKNATECKNCKNNYIHHNLIENNWYIDRGNCILFQAVQNGEGGYWYTVQDVEVAYNIVRHCGAGIGFTGKGGNNGGATQSARFNVHHNLFYGIKRTYPQNLAYTATPGECFYSLSNSEIGIDHTPLDGIKFNHNTCDNDGIFGEFGGATSLFSNLEMKDNLGRGYINHDVLIAFASGFGGTFGFNTMFPGPSWTVTNNAFAVPGTQNAWPTNTWFERVVGDEPATLDLWKAIFVNRDAGNYTVAVGSPYKAGGANDATDGTDLGADMTLLPGGGGSAPEPSSPTKYRLRFRAEFVESAPLFAFGAVVMEARQ